MRALLVLGALGAAGGGYYVLTRRRCSARSVSERANDGTEIIYVEERCRSLWQEWTGTGGPARSRQDVPVTPDPAVETDDVGAFFDDVGARWDALRALERVRAVWRRVFGADDDAAP